MLGVPTGSWFGLSNDGIQDNGLVYYIHGCDGWIYRLHHLPSEDAAPRLSREEEPHLRMAAMFLHCCDNIMKARRLANLSLRSDACQGLKCMPPSAAFVPWSACCMPGSVHQPSRRRFLPFEMAAHLALT